MSFNKPVLEVFCIMRPKLSAVPRTTTPPWRFHSRGLLRLLILAVTFSLLSLGHGLWWWIGFLLLAAVLISIGGRNSGPVSPWLGSAGLLWLAFVHVRIVAASYGIPTLGLFFAAYFLVILRRRAA